MASTLATTRIGSPDAPKTLVMLHGIFGRGRNWQSIAKGFVSAQPGYSALLVDLPHHGNSGAGAHGDDISGLAAAVTDELHSEGIEPDVVLGHSFGGKVALAMSAHWRNRPLQVWVIDSTPEVREPSGSAWSLLQSVRQLPARFDSREDFVEALTGAGWAPAVARWMATNLERQDDNFAWRLDLDVMEQLLRHFFAADLWPAVEQPPAQHVIHFIKATESEVMSDDTVRRAEAAGRHVHVHRLEGGHWIHAEQPQAVVDLLAREA